MPERFVALLRMTADGALPWVLHAVEWDESMLRRLCDGTPATGTFVELAGSGVLGAGDLTILAERDMFATRTTGITVSVWTHDERLAAYAG